ncbi:MAG: FHA domain-containing protein [Saccharofermentans sp.]|nr:FHA domain-containing protein [Saccharofermentans sp.]
MEIRKGPFGHFAVEKIGSIDSICDYSREIISENILGHMLPVYINPSINGYELYYDYSGLSSLSDKRANNQNDINKIRSCLGDLLLTFSLLPDYLLSPSSLKLDEKYVFIDDEYKCFSVCFNPIKTTPDKLNIAALGEAGLREFLESDSLTNVIKTEEIDKIIYALQTNDEVLFIKCANEISTPIIEEIKQLSLFHNSDFSRCIITSIFSLFFVIMGYSIPSVILLLISIALGLKTYLLLRIKDTTYNPPSIRDDSKTEMLFGNNNSALSCLILTSKDINGDTISKSIYTNKATIGSDRFLCDIFIDDDNISAIHAEITQADKSYFIRDLSRDNSTFLDNVRLEPQKEYEIKSGQTLLVSRTEFQIEIM